MKLVVEEADAGEEYEKLAASIGANELVRAWRISLVDLFTGEAYEPAFAVELKAAAPDVSGFEEIRIASLAKDGRVVYYDCSEKDGFVAWSAEEFAFCGLIGGMGEAQTLLEEAEPEDGSMTVTGASQPEPETNSLLWLWILLACLGVAAIVIIIVLIKRNKDDK